MTDFVQSNDPPLAISRKSPCTRSNPGEFSPVLTGSAETLGESSPTVPIRGLVVQSLALSSPNRDVQPSASAATLDQLRNSDGSSSSCSLETLANRSQALSFVCSENTEGRDLQSFRVAQNLPLNDYEADNHPQTENCSNSPGDSVYASGGWCSSSRTVNSPPRRFLAIRGSDSFDDHKPKSATPGWGTSSSSWSVAKQQPLKIEPTGVGAGLSNLGNTCFINSVLQCFTHTVPLIESLRSYGYPTPCNCGSEGFCVAQALQDHIGSALRSSGDYISPDQFVDNLSYFSAYFQKYHQEDAHEFLQSLLDRLERCLNPKAKTGCVNMQDVNIVDHVFGGCLVSRLRCCNCNSFSDRYEPSLGLSLEIEDVDNLQSALESFTCVEKLEDQFTCDNCKEKVSKEKQLMLDKVPLVATFHLKRFKNDGISMEKIYKHVEFPLELDLRPYMPDNQNNEAGLTYHLYAFVEHLGISLTSGHYSSYVRSTPGTWHKFDDSMVTRIEESCVLSQDSYILFYAREGTPWFSSVFEQIKPWLEESTSNSSPKSVLDPACRDCVSDHSDESNIDNSRPAKLSSMVEVPMSSLEGNLSENPIVGFSALHGHQPEQNVSHPMEINDDDAPMTDAFEPRDDDDLDKPCSVSAPEEKSNLCPADDRAITDNACFPTLGVKGQDQYVKHQEGSFQIQYVHLKNKKTQEESRKKPSGSKVSESREREIALRLLRKQPTSRARLFAAALDASCTQSPTKRMRRVGKDSKQKRTVGLNKPRPNRR